MHPEKYCDIYRELAEVIGDTATKKLWKEFGGLTISLPQHLYSREYTRQFIRENMQRLKPKDMARKLNLSERRIRQIIREIRLEDADGARMEEKGEQA